MILTAGVVRLLIAHAVDRDQRAVADCVRQPPDPGHRRLQVVGDQGEQVGGLPDVTPGRRDNDLEPGGQTGQGERRRTNKTLRLKNKLRPWL